MAAIGSEFEEKLAEWILVVIILIVFWWMFLMAGIYYALKYIWNHKFTLIKDLKLELKQFFCKHKNNTLWTHHEYLDIRNRTCHDCGLKYADKMTSFERAQYRRDMRKASFGF